MIGTILDGRYKIEKKIGSGGFANVYLGSDLTLKRTVAVKILHAHSANESFKRRFSIETEILANLSHPNIVTVFDGGEHNGCPYLIMELVNGPSLEKFIAKTSLALPQLYTFAVQICRAMAYAQGKGVIHRDLTLRNVMLNEDTSENAQIKILDFGLVKLLHSDMDTTGSAMMGTPYYMSPEQVQGMEVDGRTDIFSFGVGIYRMLNGHFPFQAEHNAAMMYAIVHETRIDFNDDIPADLVGLVLRCLEKDPEDRPKDFNELADAFELMSDRCRLTDLDTSAPLPRISTLADRSSKRNPYLNRLMIKRPTDFFGRDKEIRKIFSRLDAPHPQSISIVGERRIGKSSLLNYIYHKKIRREHMRNYDNALFVYLDFQTRVDFDVPKFIDFLFSVFSYETEEGRAFADCDRTLDKLKEAAETLTESGKRIILLLDEFEVITRNENFKEDFFSFMRSLANSYHVAFVTSSRDELQLMCHNKDISDSPFFNIFSNLPLRPFTRDEALDLISTPSKKEGVPLEIHAERIIDIAGLFPFYLQIACSTVFEHLLDKPETEPDWDQIVKSFKDESFPHYSHVWERMDEQERENLHRIASGKPIGKKYGFVSDNLARKGYLVESGDTARMCSSSFSDFVLLESSRSSRKKSMFSSIFGKRKAQP